MRKPVTDNSNAFSLFPFIAVLLCTMGSLLIILVVTTRAARDYAKEQAEAAVAIPASDSVDDTELRRRVEEANAALARIAEVREVADVKVRDEKLRLSYLEEQTRKLVDDVGDLKAAAVELMAIDEEHYDDRRQAERELERLRKLVSDSSKEVETLKEDAQGKTRSYAIVPYDGPNGTNRRPIYIECRGDAVIIQPENIKLTPLDFLPPLDAGSPLAAALRAAREELIRTAPVDASGKPLEPYPLILVRPDGVETYYVVRRAVAEWDDDFGYEFVDGDWQLSFPPADPKLAMVESQAVEHARIRRRVLASAAPRAYRSGGGGGGFGFGRAAGDDEFASSDGDGDDFGNGTSSGANQSSGGQGSSQGENPYENLPLGDNSGKYAAGETGPRGGQPNGARGASAGDRLGNSSSDHLSGTGDEQSSSTGGRHPGASGVEASDVASKAGGQPGGNSPTDSGRQENGDPGVAAAGSRGGGSSTAANGAPAGSGGGSPSPSANGASGPNMTTATIDVSPQEMMKELADSRGENWALEGKGTAAVPVRRSIRVVVRGDRFAILPEGAATDAAEGGRAIPLNESTSKHVDEIVNAVQQEVRGWGIAGRGLYWRPVLVMQVGPDGEARAAELTRLLRNSGIELRPNAAIGRRGNPSATTY